MATRRPNHYTDLAERSPEITSIDPELLTNYGEAEPTLVELAGELQFLGRQRVAGPSPAWHTGTLQLADHGRAVDAEAGSQVVDLHPFDAQADQLSRFIGRKSSETLGRSGSSRGHRITAPTRDNPLKKGRVFLVGILAQELDSVMSRDISNGPSPPWRGGFRYDNICAVS